MLTIVTACSKFPPQFFYVPVTQGYTPNSNELAQLKLGMSRNQVFKLLGRTNLNYINNDEYSDYIEYKSIGVVNNPKKTHVRLYFFNDKLSKILKIS